MNLFDLMIKRRSVRCFKDTKIPDEIINNLVQVANNAPSGGNIQPISIIIIQKVEGRKKLTEFVGGQPWVENAPLSIIFCIFIYRIKNWTLKSDTYFQGENSLSHFLIAYADLMGAAQNVVILAESYGLGSVYVGSIQSKIDDVREYFSIPKYVLPMMFLSIGYPESIPRNIPKLKHNLIAHNEKYKILSDDEIAEAYNNKYGDFDENVDKYLEKAYIEVIEASKQHKTSWIKLVKQMMKKLEIRNHAQFLFKLRYPSKAMVELNKKQIQAFKNAGFNIF